jgi:hypothetical protein
MDAMEGFAAHVRRVTETVGKDRAETLALRTAAVNAFLAGKPDPDTPEGRGILHRRALFVTALAEQKLWP